MQSCLHAVYISMFMSSISSIFSALIRFIQLFKKTKNALGCMNVILLHNNHRHVSTIHVAILRRQEYKYNYNVSLWSEFDTL